MMNNWLSIWVARLVELKRRLAFAAMRPSGCVESWDRWDVTADRRRELNDLDAMRTRFPDHA
ncbi:MAG: hypothetical protein WBB57_12530 [Mycobacterium sp.]